MKKRSAGILNDVFGLNFSWSSNMKCNVLTKVCRGSVKRQQFKISFFEIVIKMYQKTVNINKVKKIFWPN